MHVQSNSTVTFLGRIDYRTDRRVFGIRDDDRLQHIGIFGKTGTGKSTLMRTMLAQDIRRGHGVALIDPHADLVQAVSRSVPKHRETDVIYLNLTDPNQPYSYNPLWHVNVDRRPLAASGLVEVFKKNWGDAWGSRMEHILKNVFLALLDHEEATLADVGRLLQDESYRRVVANHISNLEVRAFWLHEYPSYSPSTKLQNVTPILNKVRELLSHPAARNLLTRQGKDIDMRNIIDTSKIFFVNTSKGQIGHDVSSLLSGMIVTSLILAAFTRASIEPEKRRAFYFFIDEFQTVATPSVASLISELRKYKVGAVLATQFVSGLQSDVRSSLLGNLGTTILFRLGAQDVGVLGREFHEKFSPYDLMSLPRGSMYLRLLVCGSPTKPFSALVLQSHEIDEARRRSAREWSRGSYQPKTSKEMQRYHPDASWL